MYFKSVSLISFTLFNLHHRIHNQSNDFDIPYTGNHPTFCTLYHIVWPDPCRFPSKIYYWLFPVSESVPAAVDNTVAVVVRCCRTGDSDVNWIVDSFPSDVHWYRIHRIHPNCHRYHTFVGGSGSPRHSVKLSKWQGKRNIKEHFDQF